MGSVESSLSIDARPHFLQALRRVLRPIIRLMIRSGIRYDEFIDVARGAYVESAIRDGIGTNKHPSRDQIAWATGIDRRRTDHYIDNETALPAPTRTLTRAVVEILHRWHTDARYLESSGSPRELTLGSQAGIRFQDLVSEVDHGVDPEAALSELLQAGSVALTGENCVRALSRSFIWRSGSPSSVEDLGDTLAHLAETLEYNLDPANAENKRLERSVFTDHGLSAKLLPQFEAYAQERTGHFLLDLDNWLAHYSDTDEHSTEPHAAAGVNVFLYVDEKSDTSPLSGLVGARRINRSLNDTEPCDEC